MNGISDLVRSDERDEISPFHVKIQQEGSYLQARGESLAEFNHACTLILGFQPTEQWEINFCCLIIWFMVLSYKRLS